MDVKAKFPGLAPHRSRKLDESGICWHSINLLRISLMKTFRVSCFSFFLIQLISFPLGTFAQPNLDSVVPADGTTGVSTTAQVVFTFSEAMDAAATTAQFFDTTAGTFASATPVWSLGNTVLTCTPTPAWVAGHGYTWVLSGQNPVGDFLSEFGSFVVGNGSGSGAGTNKTTTFTVGKIHLFDQTSPGSPVLDPLSPYDFTATTGLASNRTANSVSLTLPTAAVSNLTHNPLHSEDFYLFASYTNLATFDAAFPSGNYQFLVSATASNQQVTVNLPGSFTQPNAPHISNFAAAQSINATQSFTLNWDAFVGGGSTDFVSVAIGNVYSSAAVGTVGALNGTSTSLLIPANTLQGNSNYDCSIGFYHAVQTSNSAYVTTAYVGSSTSFTLATSGNVPPLVLTNALRTVTNFMFDVKCSIGQTFSVDVSSNLLTGPWTVLLTTNSPVTSVHVSDPKAATNRSLFYRARNGN